MSKKTKKKTKKKKTTTTKKRATTSATKRVRKRVPRPTGPAPSSAEARIARELPW
jgi:hypothetical protein